MRIIAGTAKGCRLIVPKGWTGRPTLDRIREALFSILYPRLDGARFLDLFAGTGANGIEALSRGAAHSTFVDFDAHALEAVQRNLATTHLTNCAQVFKLHLPKGLVALAHQTSPYNIVFADPPHAFNEYGELLDKIVSLQLLVTEGVIVIEHSSRTTMPDAEHIGLTGKRAETYGETTLTFFY